MKDFKFNTLYIIESLKEGEPVLLVKSSDEKYNKILTKEELQKYRFNKGKIERG